MDQQETTDEEFDRIREERQREVDRISLELLSNTKQYKKYIAKNHPEERIRLAEDTHKFLKYKNRIAELFGDLLEEYEDLGSTSLLVETELQKLFKECVQKTIQHLEWKDCNSASEYTDNDMLFEHAYAPKSRATSQVSSEYPFSFWGATITKSKDSERD